jgi:hypothetical protein
MKWFSWIKRINPQTVINNVSSGLDKLILTDEERLDFNKKLIDANIDFVRLTQNENTIRSITRRYIAILIIVVYLLLILSSVIFYTCGQVAIATFIIGILQDILGTSFISVIIFFFGSHIVNNVMDKRK